MLHRYGPAGRADMICAWPVSGLLHVGRAGVLWFLSSSQCCLMRLLYESYASLMLLRSCPERGHVVLCEPV
ncbi:hypothetical protein PanWU01x14_321140, partial [Parasponia andersonii]